jgi:hypothetical protein
MDATEDRRKSSSDRMRGRAALSDALPAFATLVAVQASLVIWNPDPTTSLWNLAWTLLPIVPALWLVWAQLRTLQRADELQRTIQLESMALGFGVTLLLALLGGIVAGAGLANPTQWLQITFIGGVLAWVGALAIKTGRAG